MWPSLMTDPGERVAWVDTAKGVCIVLVVMMHATLGVGAALGGEGFLHGAVAFARPFRMPDFFLVSGLFLSRVIDRDWRRYLDKRVVHFAYFYLLWLLIHSSAKYDQVSGGGLAGFAGHLAASLVEPYSTLWFIYLLAVFSVVTKLLRSLPPLLLLGAAAAFEMAPIQSDWSLLNEFSDRWVYFLAGYLLAPQIFRLADWAARRRILALAALAPWAAVNGFLGLTPSVYAGYPTLAALPVVSLALGAAGAIAVVTAASILTGTRIARPFRYAGQRSMAIYLAFVLPMAATRSLLVTLGVENVGLASLVVTVAALAVPLALERLVRNTPAAFLFKRPPAFRLPSWAVRPRRPEPTLDRANLPAAACSDHARLLAQG